MDAGKAANRVALTMNDHARDLCLWFSHLCTCPGTIVESRREARSNSQGRLYLVGPITTSAPVCPCETELLNHLAIWGAELLGLKTENHLFGHDCLSQFVSA